MKGLNILVSMLALGSLLLPACKQITKSVDETFHPNSTAANKTPKDKAYGTSGEYTPTSKTISSTSSSAQHIESHELIVNGDTLNPADMQEQAKVLFKELDSLQKNNTGSNNKKIQEKINELLKNMHLPQKAASKALAYPTKTHRKQAFLTLAKLENAQMKLNELPQYAGKEIQVYQTVNFDEDGSITLMLQHPENPKYADEYTYKYGKWSVPKPVQIVVKNDMERRLIPLNKISFPCAVKVLQQYNQKALQVEGAKPTTYVYLSFWDGRMRWFPDRINGTRERYSIAFDPDGTLKSFAQD